jgi:hypothetical protein
MFKRFLAAAAVAVAAGAMTMALPAGASTNFSNMTYTYTGVPGEYITQGCSVSPGDGVITNATAAIGGSRSLQISFTQTSAECGTHTWSIWVLAPVGQKLTTGTYSFTEAPFNTTGWGVNVSSDDRGCDGGVGTVTIKWLHTDHRVLDLYGADVAFSQYCYGATIADPSGEVVFGS